MSRRKKRLILYSSPVISLLVLAALARVHVDRVEAGAEALATSGQGAIKLFKEYAGALVEGDLEGILACYGPQGASQGVWHQDFVSDRDGIQLYRWRGEGEALRGEELSSALSSYMDGLGSLEFGKLKLASVEEIRGPDDIVTRGYLWLRGQDPAGQAFESQALFRFWLRDRGQGFKIERQELIEGTTVRGPRQGFGDVASEVGIDFAARRNPQFSTPEWEPKRFGILKYGSAGVSATDYDGDGYYDLYFADGASARLYRNLGPGEDGRHTYEDVTVKVGLPLARASVNVALFADLDNDGDQDLFLGNFTTDPMLFRNDGPGEDGHIRFIDVTDQAGLGRNFVVVATAGDYDGDGLLDLYLGRYLDPRSQLPTTLFYTRNSEGNSLLRNLGDLRFQDVTESAGVRDGGLTLGVAWADYDEDGDQDLYVANDFGRNALYRNEGDGRFTDVSLETGTLDFGFGMSASWADVDNDLDLDLYVSNVHSGQRWYGQAATLYQYLLTSMRQGTIREDFPIYQEIYGLAGTDWRGYGDRMVKGNSLMTNDGTGNFVDVAEDAKANPYGWYWASTFFDYDNDGYQDIYAANGWITAESKDDL